MKQRLGPCENVENEKKHDETTTMNNEGALRRQQGLPQRGEARGPDQQEDLRGHGDGVAGARPEAQGHPLSAP